MTNFEQVGMRMQYGAANKEDAIKKFDASCTACCTNGRCWHACKDCGIKTAHELMLNEFSMDEINRQIEERLIATQKRLGLI